MKINYEPKLDFDDVLLAPHRSRTASRSDIQLARNFSFYHCNEIWEGVPIFAANMDTTGSLAMSNALEKHDMPTCLHKHYDLDNLVHDLYYPSTQWWSMGINDKEVIKLREFIDRSGITPNICIDVANGYTEYFVDFCSRVRDEILSGTGDMPIIMAGNVCTPEMVQELILHGGVDIVKIGIGPGSACTTRLKTGVGFPQLSAIIECGHAAHGLRNGDGRLGLVCADGGCRTPADVCKAFAAGADFVMLGGMLAGTHECEGDWQYEWLPDRSRMIRKSLKFYGMSSNEAQTKYGGIKDYRASEGRVKEVPYKGPVKDIILDVLGGLRSACAYIGATKLKDMNKCAEFNLVNRTHFDQSV
jgi:GMP reductase